MSENVPDAGAILAAMMAERIAGVAHVVGVPMDRKFYEPKGGDAGRIVAEAVAVMLAADLRRLQVNVRAPGGLQVDVIAVR